MKRRQARRGLAAAVPAVMAVRRKPTGTSPVRSVAFGMLNRQG